MPYPVRYSTRSYQEYEEILDYVLNRFGATVAAKVDMHFEKIIDQIEINPNLYPKSEKKSDLRRCVISSQTTLFYRFDGKSIELISFRGNKMNPASIGL